MPWYKDAVVYQLHVRAFHDSDADGIGDFRGLTQKLDYIQDLGANTVWLLPFYPSPLKDDGYDIADYTAVHPNYGTMAHFRRFLDEAHRRGIRVVTELVLNHTSDQHPWFQKARRAAPGTKWRDFYVWSDTPERYQDARIIFSDFESSNWAWDPVAGAYYWHRFYSHQPDLNFDNPRVREEMLRVVDYWLDLGVDGLRLDAVPYLFEREGTTCENLPETHAFLKELRAHVDTRFPDRLLLAEANQWPEDASAYFGDGDECHMAFHFPVMPRLFMAVQQEDRFPVVDILQQTPEIPENAQWAVFLRNHDELTLEMVSDEERDSMYRSYARNRQARINLGIRRRLAPLLENDRRKIELMNALLLSLPGTPILYYGDELGMGDNIYLGDRNGVRTPMQWSADRNAGFSRANPQQLYLPVIIDPEYHFEALNVEAQHNNPNSLFWWTKRMIALRKRSGVMGRGDVEFLFPDNPKVLAFVRTYGDERVLVVANLSRHAQYVELGLQNYEGMVPVEVLGGTRFPPVGRLPYLLTLGPYGFVWLSLEHDRSDATATSGLPAALSVSGAWESALTGRDRTAVERVLSRWLRSRRWYAGKERQISSVRITATVPLPDRITLTFLTVSYTEGEPETYVVPLGVADGDQADTLVRDQAQSLVAMLRRPSGDTEAILYDASVLPSFGTHLLDVIAKRRRVKGDATLIGHAVPALRRLGGATAADGTPLEVHIPRADQSNSSLVFDDRFIMKLFRKVEPGENPDLEIGRFLSERARFPHVPALCGALEYRPAAGDDDPATVAVVHQLVPNEGDAWSHALGSLGRYYERLLSEGESLDPGVDQLPGLLAMAETEPSELAEDLMGDYLDLAELLGRRTAELHGALASDTTDEAFAPEPITAHYQRALYQGMRATARRRLRELRRALRSFDEPTREVADEVLAREDEVMERFEAVNTGRVRASRIRGHGDYHLGQVLYTGNDFVIIDFEGEPARPLSERRIKRVALRDVGSMLRSYDYAAEVGRFDVAERGLAERDAEAFDALARWAAFWQRWVGAAFLRGYIDVAKPPFATSQEETALLLPAYLLEKALYEVSYELGSRPNMVGVPLRGIRAILEWEST
ncbi:MAG TPA: maltose alpha-D-glucosyltransferase [Acidimicrobiales bacterium]|nr:maltose alpha-D-glucosyltransferase [Acidimicrobiales bacterium]